MSKLLYQGHNSSRITTNNGTVIYIDPYVGNGYDLPADIILVTHQHGDHNQLHLVTQKDDCILISEKESLTDGKHQSFEIKGVKISAVEAQNKNHDPSKCVGYIIEFDNAKVYIAGDTSTTDTMSKLGKLSLTHALLPIDGVYNMNAEEAAECAKLINAQHNIPVHMKPQALFDMEIALTFNAPNRLIVKDGEEIEL